MKEKNVVQIDILSGFLGAGKTTLLNKLLKEAYFGERVAVLENEFGTVGVDGSFIEKESVDVTEMTGGCICCSLRTTLVSGLIEICQRFHPDRVIIEPTGLADLEDIARPIAEAAAAYSMAIDRIITVVNGAKFFAQLRLSPELIKNQIRETDLVVLSRAGECDSAAVAETIGEIRGGLTVIRGEWNSVNGLAILAAADAAKKKRGASEHTQEHGHSHKHHRHGEHEHSADAFTFFSTETERVFNRDEIAEIRRRLSETEAIRAKGILPTAEGTVRVDYVDGDFTLTPLKREMPGKFVVIGKKIDEETWETLMRA